MNTPIAFIIFNRPQHTAKVLDRIRELRPAKLYIIADGPREDRPEERELCRQTRAIVTDGINWDCEVIQDFSEINLGCAKRVSSGLNRVFKQEEQAIILEDDCLVDPSFIPFAEEMLDRYRNDEQIMAISASRQSELTRDEVDLPYTLTAYFHCWGWATWRRAWQHFEFSLEDWRSRFSPEEIQWLFGSPEQRRFWTYIYDRTHRQNHSWAYRFQLSCWEQNGLFLIPRINMAQNIGFDDTATHTLPDCDNPCQVAHAFPLPVEHPPVVPRNLIYERKFARNQRVKPLLTRAALKFTQVTGSLVRSLFV